MFDRARLIVNRSAHIRLTMARSCSRALAATLFPPRCCLCESPAGSLDLDLCACCRDDLPWAHDPRPGEFIAMRFEPPVDELIRDLKYRGVTPNACVLGVLLAQAVQDAGVAMPRFLVPVPLHDARLRERGFNQAAALARYAGRLLGIPLSSRLVRRVRDTPSQTALGVDARHRNVSGAFAVSGAGALRRLSAVDHVAIVDDVITTGSTVAELRNALLAAGVARVDVWAVARAR